MNWSSLETYLSPTHPIAAGDTPMSRGTLEKCFQPELVVDLLDPHTPSLADAWAKAIGIAEYADKHQEHYARIQLIMVGRRQDPAD
jgi:hypothetical protein